MVDGKTAGKWNLGAERGASCTVCNVLHSWSRGQKNEKQNRDPNPNKNAGAGYQGLVKGEGLLADRALSIIIPNVQLSFTLIKPFTQQGKNIKVLLTVPIILVKRHQCCFQNSTTRGTELSFRKLYLFN